MPNRSFTFCRRFKRFGQWGLGLYLYNSFNRFYDFALYTWVIAKWGALKGGAVMMALSFEVDLVSLRL